MQRSLPRTFSAFFVGVVLATSCGSEADDESTNTSSVRFQQSGAAVAQAEITPLAGFTTEEGVLFGFGVDANTPSTLTDDDGGFALVYRQVPETLGVQVSIDVPSPAGPAVGRLDFRQLVVDEAATVEIHIPQPIPCTPDLECGQELLPDLRPLINWSDVSAETDSRLRPATEGPPDAGLFPEETWFISEEGPQTLLRFATVAANIGDGPLDVIAAPGTGSGSPTWQRIWTETWHFEDHEAGEFIYHPTHDHIHFDAFERYRLLDVDGSVVASSEKVSFCLRDSIRIVDEIPDPTGPMLADSGDCAGQQQVINPGFGDHYHALLDDQWIDITGVAAGEYIVEVTVDPEDRLRESNEENNVGTFPVTID